MTTRTVGFFTLVLSFSIVLGAFPGGTVGVASNTHGDCPPDTGAGNHVAWHLERYGAGCHENGFTRFPEGEQIDRVGDPPWVPL